MTEAYRDLAACLFLHILADFSGPAGYVIKHLVLEGAKGSLQYGIGADRVAHRSTLHVAEFKYPELVRRQFRIGHAIGPANKFHPCCQRIGPLPPSGDVGTFAVDFYRHLAGTGHHRPAAGADSSGRQIRPKMDPEDMADV